MKKRSLFLLIPVILLSIASCKKKDNNSGNSTGGTSNGGPVITSSTATSWYGQFFVNKYVYISAGGTTTNWISQVFFYKQPEQAPGNNDAALVDTLQLNGIPMLRESDSSYLDTSGILSGIPHTLTYPYTFRVVSSGIIPSFSYTENGPYPNNTGASSLPDTIYKNAGLSIDLSGISNSDFVSIAIGGGSQTVYKNVLPPFPAVVTFSPAELVNLDTSSSLAPSIQIGQSRSDSKSVNGKPMWFNSGLSTNKVIRIK